MPARPRSPALAALALAALVLFASRGARAADATPRFLAVAAFEEGRFEDVVAVVPSAEGVDPELAYLRARALAELRRFPEALASLAEVPVSWPEQVREDVRRERQRWAAEAGRCSELDTTAKLDAALRLLHARCAFAAGELVTARALLHDAKGLPERLLLARSLVALGELDSARPLARALYVEAPHHDDVTRIADVLRDASGRITLSAEEHLRRAKAWLDARRPDDALHELDAAEALKLDGRLKAELWHLRGEALFRTRKRYPEAAKAFARAAKLGGESEAYDAFHAVRAQSRAGENRAAIKGYREFAKRYPKSSFVADALYLSAWLSSREKLPKAREALAAFASSDVAERAKGLRRDAHWELAWLALREGDTREAERWLERYARGASSSLDAARAAYWRGRAAALRNDGDAATAFFENTLSADPLGYYAQLAAQKLAALGTPPEPPWSAAAPIRALPQLVTPPAVAFYARLGLADDAARAAEAWLEPLSERAARVAGLLATGHTAKTFAAAEPLMREVLQTAPDGGGSWLWRVLFPAPYRPVVHEVAARHGLDPHQVYGHMQVESRYKIRAVSGADALGLLQLLPQTARSVASGLGIPGDRAAALTPRTNITLGVTYLGGLVRHYGGQLPPAIAAYNAGTARVDEWLRRAPEHELDRWVEEIPVEQTRNYVRRVITAWARYHALAHPDAPYAIPLPERVSAVTK